MIKKETLTQLFSCEFYEVFKNALFTEHLWTTGSLEGESRNFQESIFAEHLLRTTSHMMFSLRFEA